MTSIENCKPRLIKLLGDAAPKYRDGFLNSRPVFRDMIVILQQEIMKDKELSDSEARQQTRALAALGDFIEQLTLPAVTDAKPVARKSLNTLRE